MARTIGKLTALTVTQANRRGYYADGGGLLLQVNHSGSKSWSFRYKTAGKLREMGLGPVHTVSLADARDRARECRRLRLDGLDPIEVRRGKQIQAKIDAANAMSFKACAEAYIAVHKAGWRNPKHAAQWPATLGTYVYPVFGSLPVQAVDVGLVMKALEPIWNEKPETASRVRGRIEAILAWATARGYRQVKIRLAGGVISKIFCRRRAKCAASSIMRRCPMRRLAPSWPSCASKRALSPGRLNSRS